MYQPVQRLIVFRLALRSTQEEFAKLLHTSASVIHSYEGGYIKKVNKSVEKIFLQKIHERNGLRNLTMSKVLNSYERFNAIASGRTNSHLLKAGKKTWFNTKTGREAALKVPIDAKRKGGIRSAQKRGPTEQEKLFMKVFDEFGLPYEFHSLIKCGPNTFVVDFAIPSSKCPVILIELKNFEGNNLRFASKAVNELALKAFRMKIKNRGLIFIAVLDFHKLKLLSTMRRVLEDAFDTHFVNEDPRVVTKSLKELLERNKQVPR